MVAEDFIHITMSLISIKIRHKLVFLRRVFKRGTHIRSHPLVPWIFVLFSIAACVWLYFFLHPPGYAVAVVGVIVALMSFIKLKSAHKVLLTLIIILLTLLEFRAIGTESEEANNRFQKIADSLVNAIETETGEGSYVYLGMSPINQAIFPQKIGEHPIYDLQITLWIYYPIKGGGTKSEFRKVPLGNLPRGSGEQNTFFLGQVAAPFLINRNCFDLEVTFEARSGTWYQISKFRRIGNIGGTPNWFQSIAVHDSDNKIIYTGKWPPQIDLGNDFSKPCDIE